MRRETYIIDYIAAGDDRERRAKLTVALEIEENLHMLKFALRKELMRAVFEAAKTMLEPAFTVADHGLIRGSASGSLEIFRFSWQFSPSADRRLFSFALMAEFAGVCHLRMGILKGDPDLDLTCPHEVDQAQRIIQTFQDTFGEGDVVTSPWLVSRSLDPPYGAMTGREFYLQIITDEGFKRAVGDIAGMLLRLVERLSPLVDEFVKIYGREA